MLCNIIERRTDHRMQSPLIGVIPAAGKGIRLRPNTLRTHKTLLEIGGISLVARNIAIMRDDLHIEHIYILVGEKTDLGIVTGKQIGRAHV